MTKICTDILCINTGANHGTYGFFALPELLEKLQLSVIISGYFLLYYSEFLQINWNFLRLQQGADVWPDDN